MSPAPAADLFDHINLILRLSQLFGAAPPVRIRPSDARPPPVRSRWCRWLHRLWCTGLAGTLTVVMLLTLQRSARHHSVVEHTLFVLRFGGSLATTLLIVVASQLRNAADYQRFFDRMAAVEQRLQRIADRSPAACAGRPRGRHSAPAELLRSQRRLLAACVAFNGLFVLLDVAVGGWQPAEWGWSVGAFVVPATTASCVLLQLCYALRHAEQAFRRSAQLAEQMLAGQKCWELRGNMLTIGSLTPLLGGGRAAEKRPLRPSVSSSARFADQLNALRLVHIDLVAELNRTIETFAPAVCGIVATAVLDLTVQLYLFYKYTVQLEPTDWLLTVYSAAWSVMIGGRIFVVVWQADRVAEQRQRIAETMFQVRRVECNGYYKM